MSIRVVYRTAIAIYEFTTNFDILFGLSPTIFLVFGKKANDFGMLFNEMHCTQIISFGPFNGNSANYRCILQHLNLRKQVGMRIVNNNVCISAANHIEIKDEHAKTIRSTWLDIPT